MKLRCVHRTSRQIKTEHVLLYGFVVLKNKGEEDYDRTRRKEQAIASL